MYAIRVRFGKIERGLYSSTVKTEDRIINAIERCDPFIVTSTNPRKAAVFDSEAEAIAEVKSLQELQQQWLMWLNSRFSDKGCQTSSRAKCIGPYFDLFYFNSRRLIRSKIRTISSFTFIVEPFVREPIFFNRVKTRPLFTLDSVVPNQTACSTCGVYIPTDGAFRFRHKNSITATVCVFCVERAIGAHTPAGDKIRKDAPEIYEAYMSAILTRSL